MSIHTLNIVNASTAKKFFGLRPKGGLRFGKSLEMVCEFLKHVVFLLDIILYIISFLDCF